MVWGHEQIVVDKYGVTAGIQRFVIVKPSVKRDAILGDNPDFLLHHKQRQLLQINAGPLPSSKTSAGVRPCRCVLRCGRFA